jgi:hypothetical protein
MKTLAKWSVGDYHRMIEAGILRDRLVELLAGEVCEIQKPQFITILSDETVNTSKNCSQVKLMSASTSQLHYRIPNQNQILRSHDRNICLPGILGFEFISEADDRVPISSGWRLRDREKARRRNHDTAGIYRHSGIG